MKFLERHLEDPVRPSASSGRPEPVEGRFARLKRWFYAGLAALALSEVAVPRLFHTDHAHFWFEDLPAWGSIYGLVSCVLIVVLSKLLGKLWLMRPENYYDS